MQGRSNTETQKAPKRAPREAKLALKSAAKPKDLTFSLNKTLCFTRRNGFLDVVLAPGGSKNLKK